MISANKEGQTFSKSMEVLKNDAPKCFGQLQILDVSFPMNMQLKQSYLSTLLNR